MKPALQAFTASRVAVLHAVVIALLVGGVASAQSAAPVYEWTTIAGRSSIGVEDGPGAVARFNYAMGIAFDPAGNLCIADMHNHTIRRLSPAGVVTTLAGAPMQSGSVDGVGRAARFNCPEGVAIDGAGNLYIADTGNYTVRLMTPAGVVTTIAGQAGRQGWTDGNVASALFHSPESIAVDSAGNVFVGDAGPLGGDYCIRRISAGTVQTVFRSGTLTLADGSTATVTLSASTLAVDADRQVFFGGLLQSHFHSPPIAAIFKMDTGGGLSLVASSLAYPGILPSFGSFWGISQLAVDPAGNLLAIVYASERDRKVQLWRMTKAGAWNMIGLVHSDLGADCVAGGLAANAAGEVSFSRNYNVIVKMSADGAQTILAGTPGGPVAGPVSLTVDSAGNVWAGAVEHGYASPGFGGSVPVLLKVALDGTITMPFRPPIAVDMFAERSPMVAAGQTDAVYFTDTHAWPPAVDRISPTGDVASTNASRWHYSQGFVADSSGNLFIPDFYQHVVWKRTPDDGWSVLAGQEDSSGRDDGIGESARFGDLIAVTADRSGDIYVADLQQADGVPPRCVIRRIGFDGTVSTLGGNLLKKSSVDEDAMEYPDAIATDGHGTFFAVYSADHTVWRITVQGEATAIGGVAPQEGSADGLGSAARFGWPMGIAVDAQGNLYVSDSPTIRKGQLAGPPVLTAQPQSLTVTAGAEAQFSVTAIGVPAPTYQWYRDGAAIGAATAPTLSIASVQAANAGQYAVVVSNALGSVTSSAAMLTIKAAATGSNGEGDGSAGGGAMGTEFVGLFAVLAAARALAGAASSRRDALFRE